MKNKINIAFSILCFSIVSACGTTSYTPQKNEPTANLIFPSNQSSYSLLGGFSSSGSRFAIAGNNGCGKFIEIKKSETTDSTNIIPANRRVFINSGYSLGNRYCSVTASFLPKQGQNYTVIPQLIDNGCSVVVKHNERDNFEKLYPAKVDIWIGKTVCPI